MEDRHARVAYITDLWRQLNMLGTDTPKESIRLSREINKELDLLKEFDNKGE